MLTLALVIATGIMLSGCGKVECSSCEGTGEVSVAITEDGGQCVTCNGTGKNPQLAKPGNTQNQTPNSDRCPSCFGSGRYKVYTGVKKQECGTCGGTGMVDK